MACNIVNSISNSDGSLTVSPTTGNVVASINVGHANIWSALQTFEPFTSITAMAILGEQTTSATAMVNIIYTSTDGSGLVTGTYPFIQATAGTDLYIGVEAGNSNVGTAAQRNRNVGVGYQALYSNTTGIQNSAFGVNALYSNTTGIENSAFGVNALYSNTTGNYNSAFGVNALYFNTTGNYNSAFGMSALYSNTTGIENSAFGVNALNSNTTGIQNSAFGISALNSNTTGIQNSAFGIGALSSNITGNYNSAFGMSALYSNTTGNYNLAFGVDALYNFNDTSSSDDYLTALGFQAGYNYTGTERNNIVIGHNFGVAGESNMLRIGNSQLGAGYGQVAFSTLNLKGFGLSPIYGLDNRHGLTAVDASAITLYTTTAASQLYKLTARILATAGTTPSATYSVKWTEGGAVITKTLTISAIDTDAGLSAILIQPDSATAITVQLTAISGTGTTVNVAATLEEIA